MQKMGLEDYSVISEILMSVNDENELDNKYNEDPGFGQDLRVLKQTIQDLELYIGAKMDRIGKLKVKFNKIVNFEIN